MLKENRRGVTQRDTPSNRKLHQLVQLCKYYLRPLYFPTWIIVIIQNGEHLINRLLFTVKTNLPTTLSLLLESPGIISQWLAQLILSVSHFDFEWFKNIFTVLQIVSTQIIPLCLTVSVLHLSRYSIAEGGTTGLVLTLQGHWTGAYQA